MQRIVFVNRFFFPDQSATSQLLSDLAFHWAAEGHDVHVVASRKTSGPGPTVLKRRETIRGVKVHRVGSATARAGRGLGARMADYLGFYAAAAPTLRALATPGTVVVAKTDPPLISVWAGWCNLGRRVALVSWLQDVYPEVAQQLGVPLVRGPLGSLLKTVRDRSLRGAAATVAIGSRMAERLQRAGVPSPSIHVIPNWVDDENIQPVSQADNALRREWQLMDKFVVGYSGNLGRAHEFETLLETAALFRDRRDIVFLFIGGGFQHGAMQAAITARGLESLFVFKPHQDQALLSSSLSVPDVHWISLRPSLEGLIVPSKFYGVAAVGRPVISVADTEGEISRLVRDHHCGFVVAPGRPREFGQALQTLMANPELCATLGANALTMLKTHFSRKAALARWDAVIAEVAASFKGAAN